jgi:hypothetical protein
MSSWRGRSNVLVSLPMVMVNRWFGSSVTVPISAIKDHVVLGEVVVDRVRQDLLDRGEMMAAQIDVLDTLRAVRLVLS